MPILLFVCHRCQRERRFIKGLEALNKQPFSVSSTAISKCKVCQFTLDGNVLEIKDKETKP